MQKTYNTPCEACVKRGYHCCNKLPLFKNEEVAKILDDDILEKLKKRVKVKKYYREVYTILNIEEDENLQIKELEEGKRNCVFLGETGCKLGKYMPEYCKEIRKEHSLVTCPFYNISNEAFEKLSDEEIKHLKKVKSPNFLNYDIVFSKVFSNEIKENVKLSNSLKLVKDELFFYMTFYCLIQNKEFLKEKGLIEVTIKPKIYLDNTDIIVFKEINFMPLTDEYLTLNFFLKKLTNLSRITISSYKPEKLAILERKMSSILNGTHNADMKFVTGYRALILAVLMLHLYKERFKMKNKKFKGILQFKEFKELGNLFLDKMYEEYEEGEVERIFDEVNEFAEALFKRIVKERI